MLRRLFKELKGHGLLDYGFRALDLNKLFSDTLRYADLAFLALKEIEKRKGMNRDALRKQLEMRRKAYEVAKTEYRLKENRLPKDDPNLKASFVNAAMALKRLQKMERIVAFAFKEYAAIGLWIRYYSENRDRTIKFEKRKDEILKALEDEPEKKWFTMELDMRLNDLSRLERRVFSDPILFMALPSRYKKKLEKGLPGFNRNLRQLEEDKS